MDRPDVDIRFLLRMRAEKEAVKNRELEARVQYETGSRKAQEDGYRVGCLDAQQAPNFEALSTWAEKYSNYLDPNYMPHDRARLAKEWFVTKNGIVAPEPFGEAWRIGYSRAIVDVYKMVDRP